MMYQLTLRRLNLVPLVVTFCILAACARRTPPVAPPPAAARPNIPQPLREVAILYHSASGYAEIANQLKSLLPAVTYRLTMVDVEGVAARPAIEGLRRKPGLFTVAIGLPAARIARDELKGPVLFAAVFNYKELQVAGRAVRGVAAMPPLDLQAQDWKKLDPKMQRVGLIVSESHRDLIPQAELAVKSASMSIRHEVSTSDRETLYLFKRLAPQIDGLWLVPDDRILSPAILRDLLDYAVSHRVRVCVFSDALLDWGALMSVSPTPGDTARTLHRVLETMMSGRTNAVPPLTSTSELVVRINTRVAGRLGVSSTRTSWVVRGAGAR
jgi:ABC-type uncharacterized transport system substrate-binding protein